MGIISKIKNSVIQLISDLRKNFGLLVIISFIWIMLLFGILFLKIYVVPLQPIDTLFDIFPAFLVNLLTSAVEVLLATAYVLIWLYLWYRLIRMYFWRTIKRHYPSSEECSQG